MRYRIMGVLLVMGMVLSNGDLLMSQNRNTKKTTTRTVTPKTSQEAKKRQAETQKEIKLTEEQIRENESKVKTSLAELGKLDQDMMITSNKINELNGKISHLSTEITTLESGITKNEKDLEKLREEYLKAVKKMRLTKKNTSNMAFIFSSQNVSQALRRMRYLKEFSGWRARQTDEINAKTEDLKKQRDALAKAKEEQSAALSLQKSSRQKLEIQKTRQEALMAELRKNGEALQSHLKKKQAEASELGRMVSQLIAEEQRKAAEEEARRRAAEEEARRKAAEEEARLLAMEQDKNGGKKNKDKKGNKEEKGKKPTEYADARKRKPRSEAANEKEASDFQGMKGKLSYPTTGSFTITSRFGRQHLPDLPDVEYDNPGVDAETESGSFARAVYKGKVSGVYLLPGYNTVVIVNHGNYYTVYGNIANPFVKSGDVVDLGSSLGTLALNEENPNHSSIHFEVWKNREKLNPQEWLR